ncbi:MAG TPA: alpha/beta hydrolase-fold protein [Aggregatilineaceae bacterium]|nr:alpha/beta hydrolase-fold protein [Aggregatilineaceae bacterium]
MSFSSRLYLVIIGVLFVLLVVSRYTGKSQESCSSLLKNAPIQGSEVKAIKSDITGRSYDLYIHVPDESVANRKYPVLYVLDGQWDFKLLDSIFGGLNYDGYVPQLIIVGITYSGPDPDYDSLRAKDYTPTQDPSVSGSGDAPKFLDFLKQELIPFIESKYPADPTRRVLMGSSYGGLFTLYAMFEDPALFSGYVAASPAVTFGSRFVFTQEAEYAENHTELPVKLFLSVGAAESLAYPVQNFMQTLKDRGYGGLNMEARTIEGERHAGNKPEAFNRGLRFIFQN